MPEKNEKNFLNSSVVKMVNVYLVDYFLFVVIYIVLISLAAGYFFILNPKYNSIKEKYNLYQKNKEKEIENLSGVLANYKNSQKIYDAIDNNDKVKINKFLPDHDDSEDLLVYVRNMVRESGFKVLSADVGRFVQKKANAVGNSGRVKKIDFGNDLTASINDNATSSSPVKTIDITLKVGELDYFSLKNLLFFITGNIRFFDVTRVKFSALEKIAELKLTTYYLE